MNTNKVKEKDRKHGRDFLKIHGLTQGQIDMIYSGDQTCGSLLKKSMELVRELKKKEKTKWEKTVEFFTKPLW